MSSNIKIQKTCQFCGKKFIARKTVTQYCSHRCASTGYKNRVRGEKIENAAIKPSDANLFPCQPPIINNMVFLNVQQTAELMGISRLTVNRYCASGKIPCVKINRKIHQCQSGPIPVGLMWAVLQEVFGYLQLLPLLWQSLREVSQM